jgi:hypothetical protein
MTRPGELHKLSEIILNVDGGLKEAAVPGDAALPRVVLWAHAHDSL